MADPVTLLTDEQIQQFIVSGYLTVQADYPASFHRAIYDQIETVFPDEGNPGNNILPRIPQLGRIFEHPNVAGALTSLLGPGYVLNPHRHCHLNPPGRAGQRWHKDCYVYDHNIRHPRFYWVLAFYYPQDTTPDMGPTGILPGKQIYKTVSDPDPQKATEPPFSLCGPAGTVAIVHFDAWHRATENVSTKNRYMLKFQVARTQEPTAPTWNHQSRAWAPGIDDRHPEISQDVWHWMCGEPQKKSANPSDADLTRHLKELTDPSETVRLKAACTLADYGSTAIPHLIAAMKEETLATIDETTAKTPDNAHGTNPTIGNAALALSRIGKPAVPALIATLTDDHWWVRRNAIEALGMIGGVTPDRVSALAHAAGDEDYRVRRNAALALAKMSPAAAPAIEALIPMLEDENRYNRFYAALALRRIGTPEAQEILLDQLFVSRWCPVTSKNNMY